MEGFPPFLLLWGLVLFGLVYLKCNKDVNCQEILLLSEGQILEISTKARYPLFHHFDCVELIRPGCVCSGREHRFWRTVIEIRKGNLLLFTRPLF